MWTGLGKTDTWLRRSSELRFVRDRTDIAEARVPPFRIVPPIDVAHQRTGQAAARRPGLAMHQPALQCRKESLDHRIVPAVAPATHAPDHRVLTERGLVSPTGVNASAIRVVEQS